MSRSYRVLRWLIRCLLAAFFHRIEISGIENVPRSGGGLVLAWHPNALVDPALIFVSFPRPIVFGARHGLFRWPVIGPLLGSLGAIPIYRAEDSDAGMHDDARRAANRSSIRALADAIANGAFSALFPEGLSHDDPAPRELKTGAARIYYDAVESGDGTSRPQIVPVGLHYDRKGLLGSGILVVYHPPVVIPPALDRPPPAGATPEARRGRYRALTAEFDKVLNNIVHPTENWEIHHLLQRARKLVRAERAAAAGAALPRPTMAERVAAFRRLWHGYNELRDARPDEVRALVERLRAYDSALSALAIDDHELDRESATRFAAGAAARVLLAFLVLPPVAVIGYLLNAPPAAVVWVIDRWRSRQEKDQATIKLLAGAAAFPLWWLAVSILVAMLLSDSIGWLASVAVAAGAFVGCAASAVLLVRYHRFAARTVRLLRLLSSRFRYRQALTRLREERRAICARVIELSDGLELPGHVLPDGRVGADPF